MARKNGRDGIPRIGSPTGPTPAPPHGDSTGETGPVDISAVRRDDEFIEALLVDGPITADNADEYQLALLLANWRAEIITPALPAGPDLDVVAAAVDQEIAATGLRRTATARRSMSLLRPVAGAAAAVALVMGGLVVFSYNSAPGDPLWNVKSVVFAQQADSTVAQIDTTSKLVQAEQLIASGDVGEAKVLLENASASTVGVRNQNQRSDLEMWRQRLADQLQAIVPVVPPVLPSVTLPVPVVPETGNQEVPVAPTVTAAPVDVAPLVPTDAVIPAPTSGTESPLPTLPPVTTTLIPLPTIVLVPAPTPATASGPIDKIAPQPKADMFDIGG